MVHIGERSIDMGNYFTDENGARCLITSHELAEKYGQLVSCPVYVRRPTQRAIDARDSATSQTLPNPGAVTKSDGSAVPTQRN